MIIPMIIPMMLPNDDPNDDPNDHPDDKPWDFDGFLDEALTVDRWEPLGQRSRWSPSSVTGG